MKNGSIYLVVKDFDASIEFYKQVFEMEVSGINKDRFAIFANPGLNLCLMNGYFDINNPSKIIKKGEVNASFDDQHVIADKENTMKVFINLAVDDLEGEYERIKQLGIAKDLTSIRFIQYVSPYYYFTFKDPDGNPIEITGNFNGELE